MSKSILVSIKPQWVQKILNGEKTIEIRKTKPSCDLPCKVYIYCTQGKPYLYRIDDDNKFELTNKLRFPENCFVKDYNAQNGKVVAEFTLNKVDFWQPYWIPEVLHICTMSKLSCIDVNNLQDYSKGERIYAWHIDNLKIYDKPKELGNFKHFKKYDWWDFGHHTNKPVRELESFIKPPQSWCYVEKVSKM